MSKPNKKLRLTPDRLREIVYTSVGAATAPWMRDNPHYVFPAVETERAIERVLKEYNID